MKTNRAQHKQVISDAMARFLAGGGRVQVVEAQPVLVFNANPVGTTARANVDVRTAFHDESTQARINAGNDWE